MTAGAARRICPGAVPTQDPPLVIPFRASLDRPLRRDIVSRRVPAGFAWSALIAVAAAARVALAEPSFHADPPVAVVEAAVNGTGSGAIALRNDSQAAVVAGSITAEPGCDASVHASPLAGFTVPAGMAHSLAISCTAAAAGMQRCGYRVRSPAGAVLLELEAVCAYGSPGLSPDRSAIDFGAVPVGGRASQRIALTNTGAAIGKLYVETTDLAGNFAVAAPCNPDARECDAQVLAVPAGGTTDLVVACTPRAAGPQVAQLFATSSAGTRLTAPVSLTCTGVAADAPVISVVPGAIGVGAVEQLGARANATVHLANAGTGTLKLTDIQIVDGGTGAASDWSVTAGAPCDTAVPPECALEGDRTVDLALVFDPGAIGVRDAILLVNYHDTADRSTSIPLRGVGRGATLELIGGHTALDFGALPLGTTAKLSLQLANRGTRDLSDAALTVSPAGPPFTVPASPFPVPRAAPATLAVACKPTAAGTFTASLHLAAPDVQTPPIDLALRCTGDPQAVLTATPPAVLLGEVRVTAQAVAPIAVASGSPLSVTAALEAPHPALTVRGAPATTPAALELVAAPKADGDLADRVVVAPAQGPPLAIAVTGAAVTARYSVPAVASLGTFCVEQATSPRLLQLAATGSATLSLAAPVLGSSDSAFDLALVSPLAYPAAVAPLGRAVVAVTPKRQALAGLATDEIAWTTDVAGLTDARTRLTATFIDNGGAIAPDVLVFGPTLIHLDTRNAQQVTLQNCDSSALDLGTPDVPSPFTIDSPPPPHLLRPGETTTFSVGFHPTRTGEITRALTIRSPQLRSELAVTLIGTGAVAVGSGGDGIITAGLDHTSFYACGSCAAGGPSGALALAAAALCVLRRRRRSIRR